MIQYARAILIHYQYYEHSDINNAMQAVSWSHNSSADISI